MEQQATPMFNFTATFRLSRNLGELSTVFDMAAVNIAILKAVPDQSQSSDGSAQKILHSRTRGLEIAMEPQPGPDYTFTGHIHANQATAEHTLRNLSHAFEADRISHRFELFDDQQKPINHYSWKRQDGN